MDFKASEFTFQLNRLCIVSCSAMSIILDEQQPYISVPKVGWKLLVMMYNCVTKEVLLFCTDFLYLCTGLLWFQRLQNGDSVPFSTLELFLRVFLKSAFFFFFWNLLASLLENDSVKALCIKICKSISTSKPFWKFRKKKFLLDSVSYSWNPFQCRILYSVSFYFFDQWKLFRTCCFLSC